MPRYIHEYSHNTEGVRLVEHPLFGIEIEVENVPPEFAHDDIRIRDWSAKRDGSLRNGGAEFISKACSFGESLDRLRRFYSAKDLYNFATSIRTSIHVHTDMRNHTTDEALLTVAAYCLVEPLLMHVCGPEREENIYCVPFYRSNEDLATIRRALIEPDEYFSLLRETCKYSALYAEPLIRFGTLELRQAPVWETLHEAEMWMQAIFYLSTWARGRTVADSKEWLLGSDAVSVCRDILSHECVSYFMEHHDIQSLETLLEDKDYVRQLNLILGNKCGRKLTDWSRKKKTLALDKIAKGALDMMRYPLEYRRPIPGATVAATPRAGGYNPTREGDTLFTNEEFLERDDVDEDVEEDELYLDELDEPETEVAVPAAEQPQAAANRYYYNWTINPTHGPDIQALEQELDTMRIRRVTTTNRAR